MSLADAIDLALPPLSNGALHVKHGKPDQLIPTVDASDLAQPLPPVPYVSNALALGPGAPILFSGFGYSLKTMSTHSAALATAAGKAWWGVYSCKMGPAVLVDFEQGRRLTQERLQRLALGMGVDLKSLGRRLRVAFTPMHLTDRRALDGYCRLFDGTNIAVVDSLRAAAPGLEENSSEMRRPLDLLGTVSEKTGCTVIVIHHNRKPAMGQVPGAARYAIRGSGALFDACSSVFVLSGEKGEPVRVSHEKDRNRGTPVDDFGIVAEDIPIGANPRGGLAVRHLNAEQIVIPIANDGPRAQQAILDVLAQGQFIGSQNALRDVVHIGMSKFRAAMAELETSGRVVVTHKGKRTVIGLGPDQVRPPSPRRTGTTPKGESESDMLEGGS